MSKQAANYPTAAAFLPTGRSISALRRAAAECEGCPLFRQASQTVFGEGPSAAKIVLVGEQPGDLEDRSGQPFVGPAGRLLDEVLREVGLDRTAVYVTNAVKHFKWTQRGSRRLHAKPSAREVNACLPWLEAELAAIRPRGIVCLGVTAAQALLGRDFRVTSGRGQFVESRWAEWVTATFHPSALLRAPDEAKRRLMRTEFTQDLRAAAEKLPRGEGIATTPLEKANQDKK